MAQEQTQPEYTFMSKYPGLLLQLGELKEKTGETVERRQEIAQFEASTFKTKDLKLAQKLQKHKNFGKTFWELTPEDKKLTGS